PLTGQGATPAIGTDAFQEADIFGITMPSTKHNVLFKNADEIPRVIAEAFHIASSGLPGPVLVDIAKDALQNDTGFVWPERLDMPGYRPVTKPLGKQVLEAARMLSDDNRLVMYDGGGVMRTGA